MKANPKIGGTCSSCGKDNPLASELCDPPSLPHCNIKPRDIRLSDVLLAIGEFSEKEDLRYVVNSHGRFCTYVPEVGHDSVIFAEGLWNLRADYLEQQSSETLAFLANILK